MASDPGDGAGVASVPLLKERGWIVRNRAFFEERLREEYPGLEDPDLFAVQVPFLFSTLSLAWACYKSGAAGAYPDIVAVLQRFGLTWPLAVSADAAAHHRAAARGLGGSAGAGGPLGGHRRALLKRLRFEALFVELGQRRTLSPLTSHGSIAPAVEAILSRKPFFAENVTADGYYRSCLEPRTLWEAHVELVKDGIAYTEQLWPGQFYLPSLDTCMSLGWMDIWQAFEELGVVTDNPVTCFAELLRG